MDNSTTAAIRLAVEHEIHYEMLPGTEVMADIAGLHQVHANNESISVVLVPQPSEQLHDPLV